MNLTRRIQVVSGVVVGSAAAGAGAGLLVAGVMLTTKLGHAQPTLIWELVKLGSQTGASVGVVLGPPIIFGLLRRAPLHRVVTDAFVAATAGAALGFILSLPVAQPRPVVPFVLAGSVVGLGLAAVRLWSEFRRGRASTGMPAAV